MENNNSSDPEVEAVLNILYLEISFQVVHRFLAYVSS